jgi:hypothetical protein
MGESGSRLIRDTIFKGRVERKKSSCIYRGSNKEHPNILQKCGSVVIKALCYKPKGRRFETLRGK